MPGFHVRPHGCTQRVEKVASVFGIAEKSADATARGDIEHAVAIDAGGIAQDFQGRRGVACASDQDRLIALSDDGATIESDRRRATRCDSRSR